MKRYSSFAIGSTRLKAASQLSVPHLFEDLAAALNRLLRLAAGNFSPDKYRERFPKEAEGTDSGVMPWQLFERRVVERKPAHGTTESWRYVFSVLRDHFSDRSTASITPEEADGWIEGLISPERSEAIVKTSSNFGCCLDGVWGVAAFVFFGWRSSASPLPAEADSRGS